MDFIFQDHALMDGQNCIQLDIKRLSDSAGYLNLKFEQQTKSCYFVLLQ